MMNESFWVAISFIVVCALLGKKVYVALTRSLDHYRASIKLNLKIAEDLAYEAQEALKSINIELKNAKQEAKEIIQHAHHEADAIIKEAETFVDEFTQKKIDIMTAKILQYEQNVINEVRDEILEQAHKMVELKLLEGLDKSIQSKILETNIVKIKNMVH